MMRSKTIEASCAIGSRRCEGISSTRCPALRSTAPAFDTASRLAAAIGNSAPASAQSPMRRLAGASSRRASTGPCRSGSGNGPCARPAQASSIAAVSRSERLTTSSAAMPPTWLLNDGPPGIAPREGFSPTRPQQAAGTRVEPPASVACAKPTMPAATAAAAPPDEPPGVSAGLSGLRASGPIIGSLDNARPNSGTVVRPNGISPACQNRLARSKSRFPAIGGIDREPHMVARPLAVAPRSFIRNGTP